MTTDERLVKFNEILASLLSPPGQAASRKKLAKFLGVSEATLSHYVHDRTKPSFDVLVDMSRFFNISLDFLVFGERPTSSATDDPDGVRAEVRRAVLESADLAGKHLDLMARISRSLQAEIESVARKLLSDPANFAPVGFITAAEALAMERYARRIRGITRVFQSDIREDIFQPDIREDRRGPFFSTVVENLHTGVVYDYLLCGEVQYWRPQVATFRELVMDAGVPFETSHDSLHFRVADYEIPGAVSILDLDLQGLQRKDPILGERQRAAISEEGCWSYISVEREDAQGGVVIEPRYRESAIRLFERGWRHATSI